MYAQDNNPLPVWSQNLSSVTNTFLHQFSSIFGGNCINPIALHIIITLLISFWHYEPLRPTSKRDDRSHIRTRFLCASRQRFTIILTRAQHARGAAQAQPHQANVDQGQPAPPAQPQGQAAPPAQPGAVAPPPVLPAPPLPPPPAVPAAPPPPAFALGPGRSHAVLNFDDPTTGSTATKLYNKAIEPLEAKFDGEADNLAVFLASVRDRARRFNWHRLITVPFDDGTTRNLLTHYGQVSLENTSNHAKLYINTPT